MEYKNALKALGVVDFHLKTQADYDRIMDIWREKTVAARNAGNDVLAAELSQCKEAIKRKYTTVKSRTCPRCSKPKTTGVEYCVDCSFILKGEKPINPEEEGLYTVTDSVYIFFKGSGSPVEGALTAALRKLEKVGDSFVTEKSPTSVKNAAQKAGIVTMCRKVNVGETDKKKFRFRVWRTDGKKATEVNQIIKQRLDNARRLEEGDGPPPSPENNGTDS